MSRPANAPVAITLILSVGVAGAALMLMIHADGTFRGSNLALPLALAGSIGGFAIGRLLRLGIAWCVLVSIAIPAMILVPSYQPPNWIFPIVFLAVAGLYMNGVTERVPLFLSNSKTCAAVAELVPEGENIKVFDLGCGLGDIVIATARARPDVEMIGVETAPLTYVLARLRLLFAGLPNTKIRFQSIWRTDISDADMVYAFLSPAPMGRLNEKVKSEMRPGSLFVSNSFAVPGKEPDVIIPVDDTRRTQLLIWQI